MFREVCLGILFIISFNRCSNSVEGPTQPARATSSEVARKVFEERVYPWLKTHCTPCHIQRPPQVASNDLNTAYLATKQSVDLNRVEDSNLVLKSKDGHCGGACRTDVEPLIAALKDWSQKEKQTP